MEKTREYRIDFEIDEKVIELMKAINKQRYELNVQYERIEAISIDDKKYKVIVHFDEKITKQQYQLFINIIENKIIDMEQLNIIIKKPKYFKVIYKPMYN
jgi:hypothetical protein